MIACSILVKRHPLVVMDIHSFHQSTRRKKAEDMYTKVASRT